MWSRLLRVWVVAVLVTLSAVAEGREGADHLQVTVLVYNYADVEPAALLAAEKKTANIYKEAGVDIIWMNCFSPAEMVADQCEPVGNPPQIFVRIEHQTQTLTADKYGAAYLGTDGWGEYCDVFYDRTLEVWRAEPASKAAILGIVMAHELGHLLLGFNAHSAAGIMQAQWHFKDFAFLGELGELGPAFLGPAFSRKEIRTIRDRLAQVTPVQRASR
jgi:hypothetical protein